MQKRPKPNYKKKPSNNLNYLLNFTYDRDESEYANYNASETRQSFRQVKKTRNTSTLTKYETLLSKFRFSVLPTIKLTTSKELHKSIKWDLIFSVYVEKTEQNCAICLSSFSLPRMTKCGHIFCSDCLERLHYHEEQAKLHELKLRVGENAILPPKIWLTCPLCFSSVLVGETKFVDFVSEQKDFLCGSSISLKLCKVVGYKVMDISTSHEQMKDEIASVLERETIFSKIYKETEETIEKRLVLEKNNILEKVKKTEGAFDEQEKFFALRSLNRNKLLKLHLSSHFRTNRNEQLELKPLTNESKKSNIVSYVYKVVNTEKNMFLDKFSLQCLSNDFGNEICPLSWPIELKKVNLLDSKTIRAIDNEFLVKNYAQQYLFPGCEVTFVEVDLANYLTKETKEKFKNEFFKRKQRKDKLKRQEKRLNNKLNKNNISIRSEFEKQLEKIQSKSGKGRVFNLKVQNRNNKELKEFLKTNIVKEESNEDNSIKSFATIVDKNGYFPTLERNKNLKSTLTSDSVSLKQNKTVWGTKSNNKDTNSTNMNINKLKEDKRKWKNKKMTKKNRIQIMSTSGRRNYK